MCEELESIEFPQLSAGTFSDYGGSSPLSQSQIAKIEEYSTDISKFYGFGGNLSPAQQEIEEFKTELLEHFHTTKDEYSVIFSNNTSGAIRALAYAFPWGKGGLFIYHADNHNSILGIRGIAMKKGSQIFPVGSFPKQTGEKHNLFAFPLESNFSGKKYPLDWVSQFHSLSDEKKGKTCQVLLDGAAFTPSCDIDLHAVQPDFIVFSLLKMFGSPGGVLLVRNDALETIGEIHQDPIDEVSIIAARAGMKVRKQYEMALGKPLSRHVYDLATDLRNKLAKLSHYNGKPVVEFYPAEWRPYEEQGGIVAFNLRNSAGGPVAHDGIFQAATANSIFLRFGLHCNPGGTYMALGWKPDDIKQALKEHEAACSLTASIIHGKHVGSVRASFGFPSKQQDVDNLVSFISNNFVEKEKYERQRGVDEPFTLKRAFIHPIKGCQGIELFTENQDPYPLKINGLRYDQMWAVADEMSTLLDRTRCPLLARIKTQIKNDKLIITAPDGRHIEVDANRPPRGTDFTSSTVCHEKISGSIYQPEVNQWWTDVLGRKAVFISVSTKEMFPLRAVFTASLDEVGVKNIEQLRPNFIFESSKPFIEDSVIGQKRSINGCDFKVSKLIPATTEIMIDCEKQGEIQEPLKTICFLHSPYGVPSFGVELIGLFRPSGKNPKEITIGSPLEKVE